ncbi:SacI homology domain-containing protein [Entophlyctis helioformis]|nr:SacI homology domain-containing protein [Entophlyctis helioformis]
MAQASSSPVAYQSLNLYISPETYTFEPAFLDPAIPRESLVIRRSDGAVVLNAPPSPTLGQEEVVGTHGIIGIIRLNAGDHVIVISDRQRVGSIGGKDIYRITAHRILPIQDDAIYISMINDLLSSCAFYFSYTYDLTHSLQRQALLGSQAALPIWQRADERFFWNKALVTPLIELTQKDPLRNNLSRFILPVVYGFSTIISTSIRGIPLTFSILTRRSQFRAGVRYHSRGVDELGNVSNFVETEQIVEIGDSGLRSSYLQTRGSMPLFWRQVVNVKYQPKMVIEDRPSKGTAFRNHFLDQIKHYGNQIVVNLINKHGYEGPLGIEFAQQIEELNDKRVRYIHFDFHEECRKMRWDRISLLLDSVEMELATQGYCALNPQNALLKTQRSVVRTNCMDCLDRTNVVQSVFARRILNIQLRDLGVLSDKEDFASNDEFEFVFKNAWADNADEISKQYSGTGALKTDFTRTGKRSKAGVLQDFSNSVVRYVKNNFLDGFRQDSLDLFLGRYQVSPTRSSPFAKPQLTTRAVSILLGFVFAGLIALYAMLMANTYFATFFYLLVAAVVAAASVRLVFTFGTEFVAYPLLVPDRWNPKSRNLITEKYAKKKPAAHGGSPRVASPRSYDIQMSEMSKTA